MNIFLLQIASSLTLLAMTRQGAEGKERIKQNALKHGLRSAQMTEIKCLLRWQRQYVRDIMTRLKLSGFDFEEFENNKQEKQ